MLRLILLSAVLAALFMTRPARAEQKALQRQEINRIEELVTKAAALVESKGKQAAFAEFAKRDSEWWHGDTSLFAYDMDGNVLLNPAVPSRVGTNPHDEKDANGKAFHQALIEMGRANGSGWVDYLISRPGKPNASPRCTERPCTGASSARYAKPEN